MNCYFEQRQVLSSVCTWGLTPLTRSGWTTLSWSQGTKGSELSVQKGCGLSLIGEISLAWKGMSWRRGLSCSYVPVTYIERECHNRLINSVFNQENLFWLFKITQVITIFLLEDSNITSLKLSGPPLIFSCSPPPISSWNISVIISLPSLFLGIRLWVYICV